MEKLLERLPQALGLLIKFVALELFICKMVIWAQEQFLKLIVQMEKFKKGNYVNFLCTIQKVKSLEGKTKIFQKNQIHG